MNIRHYLYSVSLVALMLTNTHVAEAQSHHNRGPISHHSDWQEKNIDEEFLMSHLDGDAGDLIGLVLPQRIMSLNIRSGRWEPAESEKVRIAEHSLTSANIRLLSSGTTVVNYKYKYLKDGKEESASYPFTIRIHRIEPEVVSLPSTIYLGWDVTENLDRKVRMQPEFAECPISFTIDDPTIVDLDESLSGTRITGRELGETTLTVETSNGLTAKARVVIQIPAVKDIDLKCSDKNMSIGDEMQIIAEISPKRAQPMLQWSSDNESAITVDQNGVVRAIGIGKATIRVVAENGEKDSITLKVKK